jgi:cytochrome P450
MTIETNAETPIEWAFNPFDSQFMTHPDSVLRTAREDAPIFMSPILGSWIITRYNDIAAVLREPELFSSKEILSITELLAPEVLEIFGDYIPMEGTLTGVDPPNHTRLRSVLEAKFSASGVASLEPMVRDVCEDLFEKFSGRHSADLLSEFAYPLPLTVVSRLLGIPRRAMMPLRKAVEEWSELSMALLTGVSLDEQLKMATHILEMHQLVARLIEEHYERPQNDLLGVIAQARDEKALTPHEMLSLVPGLFLAGHEAPANVFTNLIWRLLSVPNRWEALLENPELGQRYFDEAVRIDAAVLGMWRIATRDTEFLGQSITAGQKMFLVYLSGNRDETHYSDPDEFSIERGRIAPHLGFGRGIHHCIGAPLARIEARVALEMLTERMPKLRLADGFSPTYKPHPFLRGMAELPVVW